MSIQDRFNAARHAEFEMRSEEPELDPFWDDIVRPDDNWDMGAVIAELNDYRMLLESVPKVYDHVTGGRVSKPNTIASAVIAEHDEHVERCVAEAVSEVEAYAQEGWDWLDEALKALGAETVFDIPKVAS